MRAARQLLWKLREVHQHPDYKRAWELFRVHGFTYQGPDYVTEVLALAEALEKFEQEPSQ